MAECLLTKLRSHLIKAPLPGLIVHPGGLELMKKHLTCCDGSGMMHDKASDETTVCTLTKRMALVALLARQAGMRDAGEGKLVARAAATPMTLSVIQQLEQIRAGGAKGLALTAGEPAMTVQVAYALAFAAVWRFAIRASVVELGDNTSLDRFVLSLTQANGRQPELVIVAGIGRLFETQRLEHLEIVIGAAYRGNLPLIACLESWPDTQQSAQEPAQSASFRRSAVKDRLKSLRSKHPFDFLSPALRRQLSAICAGVEKDKPAPSRKERAPARLSPEA